MANEQKKIDIYHKPDIPPEFMSILGDLRGQYGIINKEGMVKLIGPDSRATADVPKYASSSELKGPKASLTAKSGLI